MDNDELKKVDTDFLRLQIFKVLTSQDDPNLIKQRLLASDGLLKQLLQATSNPYEVIQQLQLVQARLNTLDGWADFKDRSVVDWKRVRSAIEHENTLVHYRLTWFLLAQALLFALFGSVFVAWVKGEIGSEPAKTYITWVLSCCSIVATVLSIIIFSALSAAKKQLRKLDDWWSTCYGKEQHPPLQFQRAWWDSISRPEVIPIVFLFTWLTLLIFVVVDSRTPVLPFVEKYKIVINTIALIVVTSALTWVFCYLYYRKQSQNGKGC